MTFSNRAIFASLQIFAIATGVVGVPLVIRDSPMQYGEVAPAGAAFLNGATRAYKLKLSAREEKTAQPQTYDTMTSSLLQRAVPTEFSTIINPADIPTGTAGVESLLARRITMPPATMAAIIAVAVGFFVSVGTAVAYCLRKSTAAHRAYGTDIEDGVNSKKPAPGVIKKRSLVDTKKSRSVKPVEIQVKVEVVGPTTVSSISHELDDEDDEDADKKAVPHIRNKGSVTTEKEHVSDAPAMDRHARMALAACTLIEETSTFPAEVHIQTLHTANDGDGVGSIALLQSTARVDNCMGEHQTAHHTEIPVSRTSISSDFSSDSDYSGHSAARDSGFHESHFYSARHSSSLLGLRSELELPVVQLGDESQNLDVSSLSPPPAIIVSLNGGKHHLVPPEISRFSMSSVGTIDTSGTYSIYATSIESSDDGISACSGIESSGPTTPASVTAATSVLAKERSPSVVSSTSTLDSIREKIRQKRISLRQGLSLSKRRPEPLTRTSSDENKETQPERSELPSMKTPKDNYKDNSRTRTCTASGTNDNVTECESMASKYKRFSRVRHIFLR